MRAVLIDIYCSVYFFFFCYFIFLLLDYFWVVRGFCIFWLMKNCFFLVNTFQMLSRFFYICLITKLYINNFICINCGKNIMNGLYEWSCVFLWMSIFVGLRLSFGRVMSRRLCLIKTSAAVATHTMKYWQDTQQHMAKIILKSLLNPS